MGRSSISREPSQLRSSWSPWWTLARIGFVVALFCLPIILTLTATRSSASGYIAVAIVGLVGVAWLIAWSLILGSSATDVVLTNQGIEARTVLRRKFWSAWSDIVEIQDMRLRTMAGIQEVTIVVTSQRKLILTHDLSNFADLRRAVRERAVTATDGRPSLFRRLMWRL
jgi:Na+/melibiose symporter-like transporter